MSKRGQVTIFLIIGIILLFVIAFSVYLYSTITKNNLNNNQDTTLQTESIKSSLKIILEQCLNKRAAEGIYLASIQGGIIYLDTPNEILITNNANIQYAAINDKIILSTKNIEAQISRYITETGLQCDLSTFSKEKIEITDQTIESTETNIQNKKVTITSKITFKIKILNSTTEITSIQTQLPFALGNLIEQAQNIIKKQQEHPAKFQPTTTTLNYFITYFPYDKITSVYSVSDKESLYNNAPLTFMFAIQHDISNYPPKLDFIPDFTIKTNSPIEYQLTATDPDKETLIFYSKSNKIFVTNDGLINFTSTNPNIILATFGVKDSHNLSNEQEVRIVVKN